VEAQSGLSFQMLGDFIDCIVRNQRLSFNIERNRVATIL